MRICGMGCACADALALLDGAAGKKGSEARALMPQLRAIDVPRDLSIQVLDSPLNDDYYPLVEIGSPLPVLFFSSAFRHYSYGNNASSGRQTLPCLTSPHRVTTRCHELDSIRAWRQSRRLEFVPVFFPFFAVCEAARPTVRGAVTGCDFPSFKSETSIA